MMDFEELVKAGVLEAQKAMDKYPQPNYVISKFAEESGEVVKAAIHAAEGRGHYSEVRDEMIQVIAMMYRLWNEGDQVHGLKSVENILNIVDEIKDLENPYETRN